LIAGEFSTQAPSVVFGAILIVIVFLLPGGFAGLLRRFFVLSRRLVPRRPAPAAAAPQAPSDS
jgi:hypothetical protein